MPTCQNCESHVTRSFVRVFTPRDVEDPRACPNCDDMTRSGSEVRASRSS
ncbi:DUF7563 family protein [Natronoarchaeum mannanilyticum]